MRTALTLLAIAGFILILYLGVRADSSVECEVCQRYAGRVECRTVLGATREEATAGAVMNACAILTGGVTDTIRCQNTPPQTIQCRER